MVNVMLIHALGVNVSFSGEHGRQRLLRTGSRTMGIILLIGRSVSVCRLALSRTGTLGPRVEDYNRDFGDAVAASECQRRCL